jgi:hypothetical protein
MVSKTKLVLMAACLLAAATNIMGAVVVPSGSTIAFTSGGTVPRYNIDSGADVNGVVENGVAKWTFASGLEIQSGATVAFGTASTPANRAIQLKATTGNIIINTTMDLSGQKSLGSQQNNGGVGGPGGWPGMTKRTVSSTTLSGPGVGGSCHAVGDPGGSNTGAMRAGGGAGYGGAGGNNSANAYAISQSLAVPTMGSGGVTYGDPHVYILYGGSGAGSGKDISGAGGGGGAIALTAQSGNIVIDSAGVIKCDGGDGSQVAADWYSGKQQRYAGGGGSGGSVRLDAGAGTVTVNGSVSAKGGHGSNAYYVYTALDKTGDCSGAGGGGRVAIYTATGTYTGSSNISVAGGASGSYQPTLLTGEYKYDGGPGANGTIAAYAGPMPLQTYNPSPADTATKISIFSSLSWTLAPTTVTSQTVYFGTAVPLTNVVFSDTLGTVTTVSNAVIGGPLADNTTYYWQVATNGNQAASQVWSFTTGSANPATPVPANNAFEAPYGSSVTLSWVADVSGTTNGADVYFGTSQTDVAARTATKYVATAPYTSVAVSAPDRGVRYYWMVDQKYPGSVLRTGEVWTFRTISKKVNLKTGNPDTGSTAWYNIDGSADVAGVIDDANVARFTLSAFSYDQTWDVNVTGRRPCAMWVNGSITFDGRLLINGPAAQDASHKGGQCISGGWNGGGDSSSTYLDFPYPPTTNRNGPGMGLPSNLTVNSQTSVDGSGAGYGGAGGYGGRTLPGFGGPGGSTYGRIELYALLGGSGGGGANQCGGGAGGGAVELRAISGDIALGPNSAISANGGGNDLPTAYPGGGGSGGAIRLVASGNVSVAGSLSANGGHGGNNGDGNVGLVDPCDNGGGGGGGRIAVYANGSYTKTGTVTAAGGGRGVDLAGNSNAASGKDGTIYTGKTATLLQTHGIEPVDGYRGWNAAADPNFRRLSWYPALASTKYNLYFGTNPASLTQVSTATDALGMTAQKVYDTGALAANTKYYWRVDYQYGSDPIITGPVWSFATGSCTAQPSGDLDGDCKVTFIDFAILASQWKVCNLAPSGDCSL